MTYVKCLFIGLFGRVLNGVHAVDIAICIDQPDSNITVLLSVSLALGHYLEQRKKASKNTIQASLTAHWHDKGRRLARTGTHTGTRKRKKANIEPKRGMGERRHAATTQGFHWKEGVLLGHLSTG